MDQLPKLSAGYILRDSNISATTKQKQFQWDFTESYLTLFLEQWKQSCSVKSKVSKKNTRKVLSPQLYFTFCPANISNKFRQTHVRKDCVIYKYERTDLSMDIRKRARIDREMDISMYKRTNGLTDGPTDIRQRGIDGHPARLSTQLC